MISTKKIAGVVGRAIWQTQHCDTSLQKFAVHIRAMSGANVPDDVLCEEVGDKAVMILNRPKALNSLNLSMVSKILPKLQEWESKKSLVIVKGAGGKAFCAGGDVREVTVASKNKETTGKEFFRKEYTMNHVIGTYKIPYIALIDGITMGGGVGMSVHGKYRVSTEKTLFAMPETLIGLFPDVGGTYFLPRLKHNLGTYLALSGTRLKGYDLVQAGIATHFCPSEKIPDLERALLESENPELVLQSLCTCPADSKFSLEPHLEKIDLIFSANTIEEILSRLEKDGSSWAQETLATLQKMCPLSLKVSLEAVRRGKNYSLAECLIMEYRLANACCDGYNFIEGVRALLIDKDQSPKWIPSTVSEVTPKMVEDFFNVKPFKGDLELGLREGPNKPQKSSKL